MPITIWVTYCAKVAILKILQFTTQKRLKLILNTWENALQRSFGIALGALEYQGELYLTIGDLDLAKANLQRLDKLCWLGCDEYDDLRASIEDYQQGKKGSGY